MATRPEASLSDLELLGPALRSLGERRGWSQGHLANHSPLSQARISAYETGRKMPTLKSLEKLLEALGCRFVDLALEMHLAAVADGARRPLPVKGSTADTSTPDDELMRLLTELTGPSALRLLESQLQYNVAVVRRAMDQALDDQVTPEETDGDTSP